MKWLWLSGLSHSRLYHFVQTPFVRFVVHLKSTDKSNQWSFSICTFKTRPHQQFVEATGRKKLNTFSFRRHVEQHGQQQVLSFFHAMQIRYGAVQCVAVPCGALRCHVAPYSMVQLCRRRFHTEIIHMHCIALRRDAPCRAVPIRRERTFAVAVEGQQAAGCFVDSLRRFVAFD